MKSLDMLVMAYSCLTNVRPASRDICARTISLFALNLLALACDIQCPLDLKERTGREVVGAPLWWTVN